MQTFASNNSLSPRANGSKYREMFNESVMRRKLNESRSDEMTINMCDDFIAEIKELEK